MHIRFNFECRLHTDQSALLCYEIFRDGEFETDADSLNLDLDLGCFFLNWWFLLYTF